jgi:hypothetical protein
VTRDSIYGERLRNRDARIFKFGFPYQSLHIFANDDQSNPVDNSLEAMVLYQFPKMICRPSGGHDPPSDDGTTSKIAAALKNVWFQRFESSPIVLED